MKQYVLASVFLVQLLIVVMVWLLSTGGPTEPETFIEFDSERVDRMVVASAEEHVELRKDEGIWTLPDGNPADDSKIGRVLEKLADATGDWPVATSEKTAKRFEVTEDSFQKRISVFSGEESLADVYLGTSPAFRRVHARDVAGGPVHSIEFSNYEASTTAESWLKKSLLRPEGSVTRLEREGEYTLFKQDGDWQSDPPAELDVSKVRSYMDRFETISVYEFSDADLAEQEPKAQFIIEDDEGTYSLTIYHVELLDDWVATSDRHVSQYGLATYVGSELVKDLAELAPDTDESEGAKTPDANDQEIIVTPDDPTE